ncbi:MAG: ATP-binding protein [Rickettsiales bacterium]|jgi:predicted kinase|nr:ATP-binding protein [Rickettsiales bacterium]
MATIHFMHGFIACGKSTYAKKLARELGIPRVARDDICMEIKGRPIFEFDTETRRELMDMTRARVAEIVKDGKDVVFDMGNWTRASRDENRKWAKSLGADYKFYSMKCTPETALKRSAARDDGYPPERFAEQFKRFEPMQADEEFVEVDSE